MTTTTGPPLRTAVWTFPDKPVTDLVRAAQIAEDAGIDTFWIGDEGPAREPFTVLAAIGTATRHITLGIAVTNPYLRHPAITAATAATVAETAGRRVLLAYGPGGLASLGPIGLRPVNPVASIESALRISRAVIRAEPVDGYAPSAFAAPRENVDLWVGARGPLVTKLAGRTADGFFANTVKPMVPTMLGWLREAARPVEVSLCFPLVFDERDREALRPYLPLALLDALPEALEAMGMTMEDARAAAAALERGDRKTAAQLTTDGAVEAITISGSESEVAREFAHLATLHDADEITAALHQDGLIAGTEQAVRVLVEAARLATSPP